MTLQDKIAALPGWPERRESDVQPWQTIVHEHRAALARLALAREFMKMVIADGADAEDGADCSCPWCSNARALLKALEEPK